MKVDIGINKVIEADEETLKFLAMIASASSKHYRDIGNSMGEAFAINMGNNILEALRKGV